MTEEDNKRQKNALSNGLNKNFNEKSIFNFSANKNELYEKKNSLYSRYIHLSRKRRRGNQNEIISINNNHLKFDYNNIPKKNRSWWANPELPHLVHGYFLLFSSIIIFSIISIIVLQLFLTIRRDLKNKAAIHSSEIVQQILECSNQYHINHCNPAERVPAMQQKCNEWELCMNRNPDDIIMSEIGAETIAETLNQFVKPLEVKTIVIITVLITVILILSNICFLIFKHFNNDKPNYYSKHDQFIPSVQMTADEYMKYNFLKDN
jgi:amino acid transporter